MSETTTTSGRFSLKARDFLKGFIIAVGTPVLYLVQEMIPNWPLTPIEKAAIAAGVTYLIKNFFSPAQVVINNPSTEAVEAVKQGAEAKVIS